MYRLVRNFSLASALAIVVVCAVLGAVLNNQMTTEMVSNTEQRNATLARSFTNTLGQSLKQFLDRAAVADSKHFVKSRDYAKLNHYFLMASSGLDVLKVKVYLLDGTVVYSTDVHQIGSMVGDRGEFKAALEGNVSSLLLHRDLFESIYGQKADRDLVASYVPVMFDNEIVGVLELYSDVTLTLERVKDATLQLVTLLVGLFGLLFLILYMIVLRADRILKKQYNHIQREVEERRQTEKALQHSEMRLQSFLEAASEWLWETDKDHKFTYFSPQAETAMHLPAQKFIGSSRAAWAEEDVTNNPHKWNRHFADLEAHRPFSDLVYPVQTNGQTIFVRVNGRPIFNSKGEFKGYRGTGTNVTEEVLAEQERARVAQQLALAFRASPALVAISGMETRKIHDVNEMWLTILGYERRDVIGKTMTELGMWVDFADCEKMTQQLQAKGRISSLEAQLRTKSGEGLDFLFTGEVLPFDGEDRLMLVAQDITARKRDEKMLQASHDVLERRVMERTRALFEAKETAEMANRAKSEFLANMSHELRTPLNAIIGFSDIIKLEMFGEVGSDTYLDYACHIKDSGVHLLNLINDILDVSAIEAGKFELREEEISIDKATESCLRLVNERAIKKNLKIETDIDPNLPMMHGDERRIKQVLINLLSNSVKFTPDGGQVTITAKLDGRSGLILAVKDTGIGIAKEDISTVLSPFGQVDSSLAREYEGTGLGLHLTRNFIELHGGKMVIESEVGKGTEVSAHFPPGRMMLEISNHAKHDGTTGIEHIDAAGAKTYTDVS
ncbi:ATP-binding protein [Magnetovibrio sp. PR-2]|uniref:PAS domain-containing sensor histidine kinase n=1 Tax=Magnetovibrio sp. PR-2 TaxID=3120356 RepID=UPI002FCE1394